MHMHLPICTTAVAIIFLIKTLKSSADGSSCVVSNFSVQSNFNMSAYAGIWYEISYLQVWFENFAPYTDFYEQYTLQNTPSGPQLTFAYAGSNNGTCVSGIDTPLTMSNSATPAKLSNVRQFNDTANIAVDVWVLGTDYINYAVIYGCDIFNTDGTCNKAHGWVHSRNRTLSPAFTTTATNLLEGVCLDIDSFLPTPQDQPPCPSYYDTATPSTPSTMTGTQSTSSMRTNAKSTTINAKGNNSPNTVIVSSLLLILPLVVQRLLK